MIVQIQVVYGPEGNSLNIMDENGGYRLAGPKPWGGGQVLYSFDVDTEDLIREAKAMEAEDEYEEED